MQKNQVPETIDDYSAELRKRLAGVLPLEKIEEIATETEAHLHDRAEELVQSRIAAEARAVAEFVAPKRLASGLIGAWSATYLRHAGTKAFQYLGLALSSIAVAWYLFLLLYFDRIEPRFPQQLTSFLVVAMLPVAILICGALACRFQPRRMAVLGLGTVLAYFLIGAWKFASVQPGQYVSRFTAPRVAERSRTSLVANRKLQATLMDGIRYLGNGLDSDQKELKIVARKYSNMLGLERAIRLSQQGLTDAKEKKNKNDIEFWQTQFKALNSRMKENTLTKQESELDGIERYRTTGNVERFEELIRGRSMLPLSLHKGKSVLVPQYINGRVSSLSIAHSFRDVAKEWKKVSPSDLAEVSGRLLLDREKIRVSERLMASSRWRFDLMAAKGICTWGAVYFSVLILADTLGGLLGSFLLRTMRRRRPSQKATAQ